MATAKALRWEKMDERTRERLDARFLEELSECAEPGLTDEGVQAYLDYRRERPWAAITTYEEGQIRKMLHRMTDRSGLPDPVEAEEHRDALEQFGARRLHLTNSQTYVSVMLLLTFAFVLALFFVLFWI